ncbi:unnamed protein product [Protopolystoma xenopodis]|uniref:Pre-mRNA splicing factor component Cdc5p/Cef1 C-terminal domain-containing protein n=1 Tax=Protopolystoma xenopodis TaxID=117903 RepID=A0A3S5CHN6_9PLAT|nr:unnamed protein product [Protopolystoma xenopodis]
MALEEANSVASAGDETTTTGLATQGLLTDYRLRGSETPGGFATPFSLEAQNILALQLVQTPLKGGENTQLVGDIDFSGTTPASQSVRGDSTLRRGGLPATPNTLLPTQATGGAMTPFQTPKDPLNTAATPGSHSSTPSGGVFTTGTPTPLRRDVLNINATDNALSTDLDVDADDDYLDSSEISSELSRRLNGPRSNHQHVAGGRGGGIVVNHQLRNHLANLPTPKNNFEIFMPDDEESTAEGDQVGQGEEEENAEVLLATGTSRCVADQAELDMLSSERVRAKDLEAWTCRSQTLQRNLPRPTRINHTVMRPIPQASDDKFELTDLQRVR